MVWSANGIKRNELLKTIATAQSMAENAEQKRLFTEALQQQCGDEDKARSQFLTERKFEEVCAVLEAFYGERDAFNKKAVQEGHSQVYAWAKKYELVTFKGSKILIFKGGADGDGETMALDQAEVVSHHSRVFDDLLKIHIDGGHCKAKTFSARIKIAHGKSIPRWAAEAFVNCCPMCPPRVMDSDHDEKRGAEEKAEVCSVLHTERGR